MCTSIFYSSSDGDLYLGRTMDLARVLNCHVCTVPKGTIWQDCLNRPVINKYSFIGAGDITDKLYFIDGVNEEGLGGAALYFHHPEWYQAPENNGKFQISTLEFITYVLGNYNSIAALKEGLDQLDLVGVIEPLTQQVTPLHYIFADKAGDCAVVEYAAEGLKLYNNPVGVLTNPPEFPWHLTNLENYSKIHMKQMPFQTIDRDAKASRRERLKPESLPLPGDGNPASRFIKAAALTAFIQGQFPSEEALVSGMRVLNSMAVVRFGAYPDLPNTYTQYSAVMCLTKQQYTAQSYYDFDLVRLDLNRYAEAEKPQRRWNLYPAVNIHSIMPPLVKTIF